ncbi:MAG: urease accessory protein [Gammaproteobacteria bacterium]|nr:urease accessory protein [Gammaproteobacteria bacterium]MCY4182087.1 urease accessory protein [Gammaproteobacteria bacterium]MCY4270581.1 urease accessory protein [Gammaproteobacteria bacterium]MCY4297234.1 urease accessory protein [Gammaproteobacteria bacterium]
MLAWLTLGFIIGLQHALEADHVAAVGTLVVDKTGIRRIAGHGAIWGLGHTLTLAAFGGAVFAFRLSIDESLASGLELLVGLMLILLGGRLLHRLFRDRVHFHFHRHGANVRHLHAHSHRGEAGAHRVGNHDHAHSGSGWMRTFLVGTMHGLAGSAAIVALTASTSDSIIPGLLFILIFGAGSIGGMALLSMAIAIPLSISARSLTSLHRGLELLAASFACGLGIVLVYTNTGAIAA